MSEKRYKQLQSNGLKLMTLPCQPWCTSSNDLKLNANCRRDQTLYTNDTVKRVNAIANPNTIYCGIVICSHWHVEQYQNWIKFHFRQNITAVEINPFRTNAWGIVVGFKRSVNKFSVGDPLHNQFIHFYIKIACEIQPAVLASPLCTI